FAGDTTSPGACPNWIADTLAYPATVKIQAGDGEARRLRLVILGGFPLCTTPFSNRYYTKAHSKNPKSALKFEYPFY
ncbi:MAG TPA: hypothetical protein VF707_14150, partial [Ardenticatenaceae bacterium]